jgi:hypothetical protein
MIHLTDLPMSHESAFYKTIVPLMSKVVHDILEDFLLTIRKKVKKRTDIGVIIDGGWSHPGWWAREHTVIALDDQTGLPLSYIHVMKGVNYHGSSRGMEGWGVMQIMKELKQCGLKVKRLTHDKDASTFNNVLQVFEDVAENFCTSMQMLMKILFLYLMYRAWMQEFRQENNQTEQKLPRFERISFKKCICSQKMHQRLQRK